MDAGVVEAPFLDVLDPEFPRMADVAAARERNWYATTALGPMVLRYREAAELLADRRFTMRGEFLERYGITHGPLYDWVTNVMVQAPVEDYKRLRSLVTKAITPQ